MYDNETNCECATDFNLLVGILSVVVVVVVVAVVKNISRYSAGAGISTNKVQHK